MLFLTQNLKKKIKKRTPRKMSFDLAFHYEGSLSHPSIFYWSKDKTFCEVWFA